MKGQFTIYKNHHLGNWYSIDGGSRAVASVEYECADDLDPWKVEHKIFDYWMFQMGKCVVRGKVFECEYPDVSLTRVIRGSVVFSVRLYQPTDQPTKKVV